MMILKALKILKLTTFSCFFDVSEISPTDSSMPSYQPICIKREPEICSEGQILGNNNEKENSSDVTSTSESSSGSESEDSERPLSAAAKYLMKVSFYHAELTKYLMKLSFCRKELTKILMKVSFYLTELTKYLMKVSFYLSGLLTLKFSEFTVINFCF